MTDAPSDAATARAATVTTRIVKFIGGHEGFVSTLYLDPVGIPTIGYGFTWKSRVFRDWWMQRYGRKMRRGDTITRDEAHQVLLALLAEEYAPPVDRRLGGMVLNVREAALSMVYNCGAGALGWKWAAALVRGDVAEAARLWRRTAVTGQGSRKRLPGLVRRRAEEADIAAHDRWPAWIGTEAGHAPPETHLADVDLKQAQLWLTDLGYDCGRADGIPGPRTVAATRRFQTDHGTLRVDGIVGPATLSALQRAIDLKRKAVVTGGGGLGGALAGGAEGATGAADAVSPDAGWIGELLLWGGLTVIVAGLGWLAWRYRDELVAAVRKF